LVGDDDDVVVVVVDDDDDDDDDDDVLPFSSFNLINREWSRRQSAAGIRTSGVGRHQTQDQEREGGGQGMCSLVLSHVSRSHLLSFDSPLD